MTKKIFKLLTITGLIIIIILSFIVPDNSQKIIPSYTFITIDRPLWLNIIISCSFTYIIIIYTIYNKLFN